jgi:hypothetical protein
MRNDQPIDPECLLVKEDPTPQTQGRIQLLVVVFGVSRNIDAEVADQCL